MPIQLLEGILLDYRYSLRSPKSAEPAIKIVGIEASSLTLDTLSNEEIAADSNLVLMKQPWPWNRQVYAEASEKIISAGARVVVLDLVFRGENPGNEAVAQLLRKYPGKVVLASFFDSSGVSGEKLQYVEPQEEIVGGEGIKVSGYANLWPEADNVIRRGRYRTSLEREYGVSSVDGQELSSLSLLAAINYNHPKPQIIPHEEEYIDYAGARGVYPAVPLEYLFVESLWRDSKAVANGSAFKDKIVIIGPTAEVFKDVHQTPFGAMSGPEIQANLIATLLQGSGLRPIPKKWGILLETGLIASALFLCLGVHKATLKAGCLAGSMVCYFAIGHFLFNKQIVLFLAPALSSVFLVGASSMIIQFTVEQYERMRTRSLLERYVSRNVAQLILQDQRSFVESLQGQRKSVTVLFSDIRGFTTLTEGARAEELVSQLNEYFHEMVGIILREGGTLQKFIGDAIMAVWGDTHTLGAAEDARRSVRAALAMRQALDQLNRVWQERPNRIRLAIGIGINHGEVVVGNIGHPQRMEFTVLGDAVNLASRLEGATKNYRCDLLIGETVFNLTRPDFDYRSVDCLVVKGKTQPIEVYTIPESDAGETAKWLEPYHQALQLYRKREFAEAAALLEKCHPAGHADALCEMYLKRCREYILHPPPDDWNGVYLLKEK